MVEFYVFATEAEAIAAEAEISSIGGAPYPGTDKWATVWQRVTDGKWVFQRPPSEKRDAIPQSTKDTFNTTHTFTIELYDRSWRPIEESS